MSHFIELKKLDISCFKGIRTLHLDFRAGLNSLFGDNATGKTSVYDALTWLLFDKDSHGNSKFTVKPVGMTGVTPEVAAILAIDGVEIKLRKTLREKWEKPRGRSEARYAGDTRDYEVDDVPRKEGEYKRIIAEYIDEAQFKMLTNIYAFARDIHWKERRARLAEVCGLPNDRDILSSSSGFAELADALGRRTVEEYKTALMSQRKGANVELDTLPVRIDECERIIADIASLPFEQAKAETLTLGQEIERLHTDIAKLDGDSFLAQAQIEKRCFETDMRELENKNRRYRDSQNVSVGDPRKPLQQKLDAVTLSLNDAKTALENAEKQIAAGNQRLEQYRARYKAIQREQGNIDGVCPTCGQPLPAEKVQAAREKFEADKKTRLDALIQDSGIVKQSIRDQAIIRNGKELLVQKLATECDDLTRQISEMQLPEMPVIEDMPDYIQRRDGFRRAIEEAQQKIDRITNDKQAERSRLVSELDRLQEQKRQVDATLAKEQQLSDTRLRVEELQQEQRQTAAHLEQLDRMIAMCEEYAKYRAKFIEESVNSHFRIARFRLFRVQVNGGLEDCCDVMVDDVPYQDLNNAMQVNDGLDIIETLSEHYNMRVPLFIDNAESVTRLAEVKSQVVRLVVSENDKELKLA